MREFHQSTASQQIQFFLVMKPDNQGKHLVNIAAKVEGAMRDRRCFNTIV